MSDNHDIVADLNDILCECGHPVDVIRPLVIIFENTLFVTRYVAFSRLHYKKLDIQLRKPSLRLIYLHSMPLIYLHSMPIKLVRILIESNHWQ